ncbi:basic proline-rich protein-like [Suncus etruscus]|uniref:basic proline-rich protein-like n=1 Tax=Suncus etruscus TaxID=109475 RepID=UPI0021105A7A|nr:basic proline-rich protein-like [Suncus etruscus]
MARQVDAARSLPIAPHSGRAQSPRFPPSPFPGAAFRRRPRGEARARSREAGLPFRQGKERPACGGLSASPPPDTGHKAQAAPSFIAIALRFRLPARQRRGTECDGDGWARDPGGRRGRRGRAGGRADGASSRLFGSRFPKPRPRPPRPAPPCLPLPRPSGRPGRAQALARSLARSPGTHPARLSSASERASVSGVRRALRRGGRLASPQPAARGADPGRAGGHEAGARRAAPRRSLGRPDPRGAPTGSPAPAAGKAADPPARPRLGPAPRGPGERLRPGPRLAPPGCSCGLRAASTPGPDRAGRSLRPPPPPPPPPAPGARAPAPAPAPGQFRPRAGFPALARPAPPTAPAAVTEGPAPPRARLTGPSCCARADVPGSCGPDRARRSEPPTAAAAAARPLCLGPRPPAPASASASASPLAPGAAAAAAAAAAPPPRRAVANQRAGYAHFRVTPRPGPARPAARAPPPVAPGSAADRVGSWRRRPGRREEEEEEEEEQGAAPPAEGHAPRARAKPSPPPNPARGWFFEPGPFAARPAPPRPATHQRPGAAFRAPRRRVQDSRPRPRPAQPSTSKARGPRSGLRPHVFGATQTPPRSSKARPRPAKGGDSPGPAPGSHSHAPRRLQGPPTGPPTARLKAETFQTPLPHPEPRSWPTSHALFCLDLPLRLSCSQLWGDTPWSIEETGPNSSLSAGLEKNAVDSPTSRIFAGPRLATRLSRRCFTEDLAEPQLPWPSGASVFRLQGTLLITNNKGPGKRHPVPATQCQQTPGTLRPSDPAEKGLTIPTTASRQHPAPPGST